MRVRAVSSVGQLNSGHFFTTYVVDVIGAGMSCGQPSTAHPQNKSQQKNKHLLFQFKTGPKNFSFILNLQCSLYLPKLVCVLVYLSFGGKKKFPWWTQRQQEKIKNKTVLFLDEDYDDVGTHKKKKKKKEAS